MKLYVVRSDAPPEGYTANDELITGCILGDVLECWDCHSAVADAPLWDELTEHEKSKILDDVWEASLGLEDTLSSSWGELLDSRWNETQIGDEDEKLDNDNRGL